MGFESIVAYGTIGYFSYLVLSFLYRQFIRPGHDLLKRYTVAGQKPYAVITGGSDGIGKAFALELAKRGFNIMLVSRTESKLVAVQTEIQAASPSVDVKIVVMDLGATSYDAIVTDLRNATKGLDVALLVNNAGVAMEPPCILGDLAGEEARKVKMLIDVNVTAFTAVLNALLPSIAARGVNGGVINTSSLSALAALPLNSVYAGSKAFNNIVSQSVGIEYPKLDVLSFTPAFIQSNMVRRRASFIVAKAPDAVNAALKALGHEAQSCGVLNHKIAATLASFFPGYFSKKIRSDMLKVRAKVLAKKE